MARPASDIRARLLAAARRRFLVDGVDGASLRAIASDAKTNVGMIVYWFESKDELFMAVIEETYARLLGDLGLALGGREPIRERLARAFERVGAATDDELATIRLVVREALLVPPSPRFARILERFREGHVAMVAGVLAEGIGAGEIDAGAPLPLLVIATFAMCGAPQIVRRIAGTELPLFAGLPPPPELAEHAVQLLFDGIASPSPRMRRKSSKSTTKLHMDRKGAGPATRSRR